MYLAVQETQENLYDVPNVIICNISSYYYIIGCQAFPKRGEFHLCKIIYNSLYNYRYNELMELQSGEKENKKYFYLFSIIMR